MFIFIKNIMGEKCIHILNGFVFILFHFFWIENVLQKPAIRNRTRFATTTSGITYPTRLTSTSIQNNTNTRSPTNSKSSTIKKFKPPTMSNLHHNSSSLETRGRLPLSTRVAADLVASSYVFPSEKQCKVRDVRYPGCPLTKENDFFHVLFSL